MKDVYAIIGAGGFGREVIPLAKRQLDANRDGRPYQLLFADEKLEGDAEELENGYRVISVERLLSMEAEHKRFNIAIAQSTVRERLTGLLEDGGLTAFDIVAAESVCLEQNVVGDGVIRCAYTTLTSNATIGRSFHLNIYAYVAHDCVVGDFVTFAPHVHCNGNVHVEDHAYVGTGAIIKPGTERRPLVIGRGAFVGMGAVVNRNVEPYTVVAGNPARVIRRLKKSEA